MRVSGLQSQAAVVVPFVHAVSVQRMRAVEEKTLLLERSTDARLGERGGDKDILFLPVDEQSLFVAEVFAFVVCLVAVQVLFAFAQLEGTGGAFPKQVIRTSSSVRLAVTCSELGVDEPLVARFRIQFQV